jgi:PAS domain S-box-containing protein
VKRPLNLLLVEDSEADAELLLAELRRSDFDPAVKRVDTETQLSDALEAGDWEIVLCDHGLPSFSSTEALRIVVEREVDIPFVILSGTIGEEAAVEALKAGARDVVLKTNLARLGPVIDRVLRDAESRRHQGQLERERAELQARLIGLNEELRASELQYRLLFEHNPQPMLVYDRGTLEIVNVNEKFATTYGYSRQELLSMTITELGPPEDAQLLLASLPTNPDGVKPGEIGGIAGRAWRHRYKDGTIIDVEVTSANLTMGDRECRIALYHNVTERNQAVAQLAIARDEAVEASNMKSAFLANVSHEVRTPMNGVLGMTELLLGTNLTDEQREYADQVGRSGEQMLAIINDILDLSKIESGHLELDIDDFDLHETINETCSIAGGQARATGLRLAVDIDDAVPRRCRGDARRLGQVVLNLVSNAVKFTSQGAIAVRITATPRSHDASLVRVEISDTGIGIEPATLERMFEPFTQADVSTTRLYGGSGLGLAIAREIVDMMGGQIGAQSQPGQGSTFWFEVELAAQNAAKPQTLRADAVAAEPMWSHAPLLLIAEDSPVNQIVAARSLERCGCRTHIVSDGHEAVEAFRTGTYDAVLMDCQMPNVDGYQATAEIRRIENGTSRTPIIAMTAHALEGDRQRCLDAGMDDYITKPMRHTDLANTLRRWVPADTDETAPPNCQQDTAPPRLSPTHRAA